MCLPFTVEDYYQEMVRLPVTSCRLQIYLKACGVDHYSCMFSQHQSLCSPEISKPLCPSMFSEPVHLGNSVNACLKLSGVLKACHTFHTTFIRLLGEQLLYFHNIIPPDLSILQKFFICILRLSNSIFVTYTTEALIQTNAFVGPYLPTTPLW